MRQRFPFSTFLLLALALILLGWVVRNISWVETWAVLRRLQWQQIAWLAVLNGSVLLLVALRWWILLVARGAKISYLRIFGYRMAVFAMSYLTPGPQFGGEVLQVYLPTSRAQVPAPIALAALTGDKLIELLTNFLFLVVGTLIVLEQQMLPNLIGGSTLAINLGLLLLPGIALTLLIGGQRPLSSTMQRLTGGLSLQFRQGLRALPLLRRLPSLHTIIANLRLGEEQTAALFRQQPGAVSVALIGSLLSWPLMVVEFWTVAGYLGMSLSLIGAIAVMVLLRIAYLLPSPAGLGTIEASLVLAFTALGQTAEAALAFTLLMRGRDVTQVLIGLWIGGRDVVGRQETE